MREIVKDSQLLQYVDSRLQTARLQNFIVIFTIKFSRCSNNEFAESARSWSIPWTIPCRCLRTRQLMARIPLCSWNFHTRVWLSRIHPRGISPWFTVILTRLCRGVYVRRTHWRPRHLYTASWYLATVFIIYSHSTLDIEYFSRWFTFDIKPHDRFVNTFASACGKLNFSRKTHLCDWYIRKIDTRNWYTIWIYAD